MEYLWFLGILIILLTILLLVYLKNNNVHIDENYKYFSAAVGLAGFTFAAMGDGLFI